jgi:hypothetical protein
MIQMSVLDNNNNNNNNNQSQIIELNNNEINNTGGGGGGGSNLGVTTSQQQQQQQQQQQTQPSTLNQNLLSNLQFDDAINNQINLEWIHKPWVQKIVRTCALFSFVSICANTPETFRNSNFTMYSTYAIDLICTLVFSVEMIAKIKIRGLFRGDNAYLFDRWCQFDGIMVLFHIVSVVLQVNTNSTYTFLPISNCQIFR